MEKKIKFSFTVYRLSSNECVFNILKFESEAQFTYWLPFYKYFRRAGAEEAI